ncbi:hypothetical protein [Williamwhitmania taraxaci]|uniref:Uncharacterized protein n=1 Tax=Williamwhitmania taraxaci TaxID=1640674 RepID=A0A1G6QY12_9BACT|nr:hypothetical protein [Williamwhitmania taraxaci]SDC96526.1 hypothetical protein SAMN05216323_106625 [Williamwhitmania taraxaci]
MKIEMGESLIQSWLKHICKCQLTQMNWKTSPFWEDSIDDKEAKKIFKKLKFDFKENDNDFVSKRVKLSQLIQQGEVDCLGVKFKKGDPLTIDKIFVVDVAFHEGSLNYGGIKETTARLIKKNIRTALSINQSFGVKNNVEIIFATPYVLNGHVEILKKATSDVENAFKEEGFNYTFRFICNEAFRGEIYDNVKNVCQDYSDSTELFVRSLKLVNLMERFKTVKEVQVANELSENEVKIGAMVQEAFSELIEHELLSEVEVRNLCEQQYSKEVFGLNFPVLIKKTNQEDCGFVNNHRRYYAGSYSIEGNEYFLCNDWYVRNRSAFEKWYAKF